jgi:hypothetical protein
VRSFFNGGQEVGADSGRVSGKMNQFSESCLLT